jgi:hypothetical protein
MTVPLSFRAESRRRDHLQPAAREPISIAALTGRYRSGQTGQTVNLLALRLRWFESSPAQIFSKRRCRCSRFAASRRLSTTTSAHGGNQPAGKLCRGYKSSRDQCEFLVASSLATLTTATVSATTTAVTASATAGRSRFPRASLIHGQWPALNGLSIEFRDGVLSVLVGTHGDKRKATRFAGEFVLHEGNFLHSAGL